MVFGFFYYLCNIKKNIMIKQVIKDFYSLRRSMITYLHSTDWCNLSIPTKRINEDNLIICKIISIQNGRVYYDDNMDYDLTTLSINELFDIIDYLND